MAKKREDEILSLQKENFTINEKNRVLEKTNASLVE